MKLHHSLKPFLFAALLAPSAHSSGIRNTLNNWWVGINNQQLHYVLGDKELGKKFAAELDKAFLRVLNKEINRVSKQLSVTIQKSNICLMQHMDMQIREDVVKAMKGFTIDRVRDEVKLEIKDEIEFTQALLAGVAAVEFVGLCIWLCSGSSSSNDLKAKNEAPPPPHKASSLKNR